MLFALKFIMYQYLLRGEKMSERVFHVKKKQNSNKTIRMPDGLIERLQKIADENDTSFKQVVVQCCEYALKNMPDAD